MDWGIAIWEAKATMKMQLNEQIFLIESLENIYFPIWVGCRVI